MVTPTLESQTNSFQLHARRFILNMEGAFVNKMASEKAG